jgi:hypothetical protein
MDRLSSGFLALACLTMGCRGEGNAAEGGRYASQVAEAVPKIEKAVGRPFKTPPKVEARSRDSVEAFLRRRFEEDIPPAEFDGLTRTYKRFGMIPDTLKLKEFMLSLLTEQVAGYYDPTTKVLYIVDGAGEEMIDITLSHELVHALQDQYFSLDSLQRLRGDNDRQVAAQTAIEGQATYEQLSTMFGGRGFAQALPGGWDQMREAIRMSQSSMPIFSRAPTVIQETLIFPYLSGAEFTKRFEDAHPDKSPLDQLPASTEQVMHENKYFGETRDAPTSVTLPAPTGRVLYENNLGEFETRLLLFEYLKDQNSAVRGAAGWDGDRYVLFESGNSDALAWLTVWDTSIDAAEFHDLMDTAMLRRFAGVKPQQGTANVRVYSARGRTIAISAQEVGGRPVVLYVDVPAGSRHDVIDLRKVVLDEP